jgi:hypothetical protein
MVFGASSDDVELAAEGIFKRRTNSIHFIMSSLLLFFDSMIETVE